MYGGWRVPVVIASMMLAHRVGLEATSACPIARFKALAARGGWTHSFPVVKIRLTTQVRQGTHDVWTRLVRKIHDN